MYLTIKVGWFVGLLYHGKLAFELASQNQGYCYFAVYDIIDAKPSFVFYEYI
jgi:hypothetical protein